MINNIDTWRSFGKLDHIRLMYKKNIDELIKDEFEGFSGIFILQKLKAFILKFMPEYMDFLVYKKEQDESFNPETFGFILEYQQYQRELGLKRWVLKEFEIISLIDNKNGSTYLINDDTNLIKDKIYYGKIPSYSFAFELFKNLGIEIK